MSEGKRMPVFLPKELETEVYGSGDGFVFISQKDEFGTEVTVVLTAHQFETIFNYEKRILKETYGDNDISTSHEDSGQT